MKRGLTTVLPDPRLFLYSYVRKLGITRETTGRNYARIYAYDKYLKVLNEGTEPLMF